LRDFGFFTRAAMLRMYETFFVPNNATLVLVGDVTREDATRLGQRYFGRIAKSAAPPPRMDVEAEPPPGGAVRLDWAEPMDSRVVVRFRIPGVGHPDRPAFDTMAAVLGGPRGRLAASSALARAGGSATFRASASRNGSVSTLDLVALARRDEHLSAIEASMLDTIEALREQRVDARELTAARRQLRVARAQMMADRGSLSAELGRFQVADSWKTMSPYFERREDAGPEEIQRLARRYLVTANRVVATARQNPTSSERARRVTDSSASR